MSYRDDQLPERGGRGRGRPRFPTRGFSAPGRGGNNRGRGRGHGPPPRTMGGHGPPYEHSRGYHPQHENPQGGYYPPPEPQNPQGGYYPPPEPQNVAPHAYPPFFGTQNTIPHTTMPPYPQPGGYNPPNSIPQAPPQPGTHAQRHEDAEMNEGNGGDTPPRKKDKGKGRATEAEDQTDALPEEDYYILDINARLREVGIATEIEEHAASEDSTFLIDQLLSLLISSRSEADRLRDLNKKLRLNRKRLASPEQGPEIGQRPIKRRVPNQPDETPRTDSQGSTDWAADEEGLNITASNPLKPVGYTQPYNYASTSTTTWGANTRTSDYASTSSTPWNATSRPTTVPPMNIPPWTINARPQETGRRYGTNAQASSSRHAPEPYPPLPPMPYEEDVEMAENVWVVDRRYDEPIEAEVLGPLREVPEVRLDLAEDQRQSGDEDEGDTSGDSEVSDEEAVASSKNSNKKAKQKEHEEGQRALRATRRPGRIPDGLGMVEPFSRGAFERDNAFFGMWSSRVYYSSRTNMVFVGRTAADMARHDEAANNSVQIPRNHPIYSTAGRGVPMSLYELDHLLRLCMDRNAHERYRVEAYGLLYEFQDIIRRIHPSLHDRTMARLADPQVFNRSYMPDVNHDYFDHPPIPRPTLAITGNVNSATGGLGMAAPDPHRMLEIDLVGLYVLLHGRPGSGNTFFGISVDFAFRIHRRSLFGYGLGRMLAPSIPRGRTVFLRLYATLVASVNRYREAITSYNRAHPRAPFQPQSGPTYSFQRLRIERNHVANMTIEDVINTLIHNRIPVEWIDHAYLYGARSFQHHRGSSAMTDGLLEGFDEDRQRRLQSYGIPPAIPQWDGWRHPTQQEILRINALMQLEFSKGRDSLNDEGWCLVGEDPLSTPGVSPDPTAVTANAVDTSPITLANPNVVASGHTPATTSSAPDVTMNDDIGSGPTGPQLPSIPEGPTEPSHRPETEDE